MNVIDAARMTVQAHPGGAESLGPRMGMSGALLRAKLNNSDRNRLYAEELELLIDTTGDHRIVHALAANCGYALQPLGAATGDSASVLHLVLELNKAGGELSRVVCEAIADEVITPNEVQAIARAGHADQTALLQLIGRLFQMASKPPAG